MSEPPPAQQTPIERRAPQSQQSRSRYTHPHCNHLHRSRVLVYSSLLQPPTPFTRSGIITLTATTYTVHAFSVYSFSLQPPAPFMLSALHSLPLRVTVSRPHTLSVPQPSGSIVIYVTPIHCRCIISHRRNVPLHQPLHELVLLVYAQLVPGFFCFCAVSLSPQECLIPITQFEVYLAPILAR